MFRTNTRAMEEAAIDMQQQIRKLNQAIGETENVINGLSHISGMDKVKYALRADLQRLETHRRGEMKMMSGLMQAAKCYETCEKNILDYAEDNRSRKQPELGWFQVKISKNVEHMLGSIIY